MTMPIEKIVSAKYAFDNLVLPISLDKNTFTIGVLDEKDLKIKHNLQFETGYKIDLVKFDRESIIEKLAKLYPEFINDNSTSGKPGIESGNNDLTTVNFVNSMIGDAIDQKASDIHCELLDKAFRVRYRLNGELKEVMSLAKSKSSSVISRIKIMAELDISEKRRPQDGKIKFKHQGREIDIRVSTLPTSFGEKAVLRLLDKSNLKLNLRELGLSAEQLNLMEGKISLPYGMILVTGPTGSGKTTTLYACLQKILSPRKNILTIEDPVEYNLSGINQCSVNPAIGFTFANALRAFLRQDPDVIMVGEIRDSETAEIAVRAALTGHLVFSTLHTNDSVSAVNRLVDIGIEPFLIASSLKLVIAQRLIKVLCSCKIPDENNTPGDSNDAVYRTGSCPKCRGTGYSSREAIYEMLDIDTDIAEAIAGREGNRNILAIARKKGFVTLRETGMEKFKSGITSYEEVLRETTL